MGSQDSFEPIWKFAANALKEVLNDVAESLDEQGLVEQREDINILISAGEYGLALEQLCSHLDEFNIPISDNDYRLIEEAGIKMAIDPEIWTILRPICASKPE